MTSTGPAAAPAETAYIAVHIRPRPMSLTEVACPNTRSIVIPHHSHKGVIVDGAAAAANKKGAGGAPGMPGASCYGRELRFDGFAHVYNTTDGQQEVFSRSVHPIVEAAFDGQNGAVLAYGATGSGKTHSMFGDDTVEGVVPQAIRYIFQRKTDLESIGKSVVVTASLYEIYMESVVDLSDPNNRVRPKPQKLQLRMDAAGHAQVDGLRWTEISDFADFKSWLDCGMDMRRKAATFANEGSSRSHAILTLSLVVRDSADLVLSARTSARIKFCDLAGSERAAQNKNEKNRFDEGCSINRGLLALGNVVLSLSKRQKVASFRESVLTRCLEDCIKGNCRSCILVCISPASNKIEDTVSALNFAGHAGNIRCTIKRNQDLPASKEELMSEVDRLTRECCAYQMQIAALQVSGGEGASAAPGVRGGCGVLCHDRATDPIAWAGAGSSSVGCVASSLQQAADTEGAERSTVSDLSPPSRRSLSANSGQAASPNFATVVGGKPDSLWEAYRAEFEGLRDKRQRICQRLRDAGETAELRCKTRCRAAAIKVIGYLQHQHDSEEQPVGIMTARHDIDGFTKESATVLALEHEYRKQLDQVDAQLDDLSRRVRGECNQRAVNDMMSKFEQEKIRKSCTEAESLMSVFLERANQEESRRLELEEIVRHQNHTLRAAFNLLQDCSAAASAAGGALAPSITAIDALKRQILIAQARADSALEADPVRMIESFTNAMKSVPTQPSRLKLPTLPLASLSLQSDNGGNATAQQSVRLDMLEKAASVQRRRRPLTAAAAAAAADGQRNGVAVGVPSTPRWVRSGGDLSAVPSSLLDIAAAFGQTPSMFTSTAKLPRVRPQQRVPAVRFVDTNGAASTTTPTTVAAASRSKPIATNDATNNTTPCRTQTQSSTSPALADAPPAAPSPTAAPQQHMAMMGVQVPLRLGPSATSTAAAGAAGSSHNSSTSSVGTPTFSVNVAAAPRAVDFARTNTAIVQPTFTTGAAAKARAGATSKVRRDSPTPTPVVSLHDSAAAFQRMATSTRLREKENTGGFR